MPAGVGSLEFSLDLGRFTSRNLTPKYPIYDTIHNNMRKTKTLSIAVGLAIGASAQAANLIVYDFESEAAGALADAASIANSGTLATNGTIAGTAGGTATIVTGAGPLGPSTNYLSLVPTADNLEGTGAPHIGTGSSIAALNVGGDQNYTFAAWVRYNNQAGDNMVFGGANGDVLHLGSRNTAHWSGHWGDDLNAGAAPATEVGVWHHVAWTNTAVSNEQSIFVDGVLAVSGAGGTTGGFTNNPLENLLVGSSRNGGSFNGDLDDVRVYDEVLSAAQIADLANTNPGGVDDADSDGMTDQWEIANLGAGAETDDGSGNPDYGPLGDPDGDTSSNFEEFTRRTDPLDNDTDDDTIWDGYETDSKTWSSATDTGTNPNDADSDDDGFLDGVENPDLPYLDENQPGSDPNLDDSDSDGFSDDVEVGAGTDPGDAMLFPAPTELPIVDDFESGSLNEVVWLSNLEIPAGGAAVVQEMGHVRITGRGHLYTRDQYDPETLGGLYIKGQWTFTGGDDFLQILTRTDAVPDVQYGETQNGIEFNASQTNGGFDIRVRGSQFTLSGNQKSGAIDFKAGTTYEFVITDDGADALVFCIWEQGNRANAAGVSDSIVSSSATYNHIAFHNREGGGRSSNLEGVEIGVLTDSDSDGMPDFWEEDNGLLVGTNDAGDDKDSDDLTNLQEFLSCTDPNNSDTDGDGLRDGVENNDGNYVDSDQTGTDRLDPDSDSDGLSDGVEIPGAHVGIDNPGTNPNLADTDSDGTGDRVEIVKGSDPTDAGSLAPSGFPILYYNFEQGAGDVIFDQTLNYFDGNVVDDLVFVSGAPSGSTPGFGIEFTLAANGYLDVPGLDINSMIRNVGGADNGSYTVSCWLKPGEGTTGGTGFIFGQTNQGMHHGLRNSGTLHSAHWGSDWDATTVLGQDVWVHATWTYDGISDTANIYLDGVLDGGPTSQTPTTGGGNLMIGTHKNDDDQATRFKGCLDEIVVWDEVLPVATIQALAAGESPIGAPSPNSDYLSVTDLTFDQDTGNISLTWNSKAGENYALFFDPDLSGGFLSDVDDDIDSQGETTTRSFNRSAIGGAGALKVFFKIVKN